MVMGRTVCGDGGRNSGGLNGDDCHTDCGDGAVAQVVVVVVVIVCYSSQHRSMLHTTYVAHAPFTSLLQLLIAFLEHFTPSSRRVQQSTSLHSRSSTTFCVVTRSDIHFPDHRPSREPRTPLELALNTH
ncbi:hypothetical protein E2C01_019033 [Portunus trituberculatus]|uniref:Uncharacterized protein n=1 Tax=Portunus trituberculatus TaxID=210409 RepID=A0A5B7DXS7_PORTR|nr:hypothetical protein [Portunus trituberculatus]